MIDLKSKAPFYVLLRNQQDFIKAQLILISYGFDWKGKIINPNQNNYIPYYIRVNKNYLIFHGSKISLREVIDIDYVQLNIEDLLKC